MTLDECYELRAMVRRMGTQESEAEAAEKLTEAVLEAIAAGAPDAQKLASICLYGYEREVPIAARLEAGEWTMPEVLKRHLFPGLSNEKE